VPRGLIRPDPPLSDDLIRLEPLARSLVAEMRWVTDGDPAIATFTFLPTHPAPDFLEQWLGRYEEGWTSGERAGFAVRDVADGAVGFAAFVRLSLEGAEGEIGYVIAPEARGRGLATRCVRLLTRWGFDRLGLRRIELRIDPRNAASSRVAERAGFTFEGILRSVAFKEGLRTDLAVWSRLSHE
jgi:RimJ/RimL family protein N-acetyltransferase